MDTFATFLTSLTSLTIATGEEVSGLNSDLPQLNGRVRILAEPNLYFPSVAVFMGNKMFHLMSTTPSH